MVVIPPRTFAFGSKADMDGITKPYSLPRGPTYTANGAHRCIWKSAPQTKWPLGWRLRVGHSSWNGKPFELHRARAVRIAGVGAGRYVRSTQQHTQRYYLLGTW
jgi:hypothetical protein